MRCPSRAPPLAGRPLGQRPAKSQGAPTSHLQLREAREQGPWGGTPFRIPCWSLSICSEGRLLIRPSGRPRWPSPVGC